MSKTKIVFVICIWLGILFTLSACWRFFVAPAKEKANQEAKEQDKKNKIDITSAQSRYDTNIDFAIDSFAGYSIFRSLDFANELGNKRIKFTLHDDGADYTARLKAIQNGKVQIAVFTADALIKASSELNDFPATIVSVIDETRGADAIVSYKTALPNVDGLNSADMKFVLVANSPSETLARVVMSHFKLNNVSENPFIFAKDVEDVYKQYRRSKPDDKLAFVLWEPYVSKMLENPNTHRLLDSSRFRGYIVDVVVCNRDFLVKNPEIVKQFLEAYFRINYKFRNGMSQLVATDAKELGSPLTDQQAKNIVNGIWWKNTQENFVQFGLNQGNLQHIEDILSNITGVLVNTKAIEKDPTGSNFNLLYYDGILKKIKESGFHPGNDEGVRNDEIVLPSLTEEQWLNLSPLGTLEVSPLVFARGTSNLTERSFAILDELADRLKSFPQFYVLIKGNSSKNGNLEANKALGLERAKAAEKYLISKDIKATRLRSVAVDPNGQTSVDFILGQVPY